MANWFTRLFGGRDSASARPPVTAAPVPEPRPAAPISLVPVPVQAGQPSAIRLTPFEAEFLDAFLTPPEPRPLDELALDDRQFVAGIRNRWHTRRLELPVLAHTSIKLRDLLRRGDVAVQRYAELLEQDSALTVEVLKAANSILLGAATPVTGTADAVVRIGLQRLETILLMAQLKAKVLKGGPFQPLGDTLVRMAMPLGLAAARLATMQGEDANVAFTRGTLFQVEHLVIVGALHDVSSDHKRSLAPSVSALHQAFAEYGPEIRVAVARAWGLEELLIGGDSATTLAARYSLLRNALASEWLGRPLPDVAGVDAGTLRDVMMRVSAPTSIAA